MEDAEEHAANALIRNGLASDRTTSRRIVKSVIQSVLEDPIEPVRVHEGDLYILDELAHEITCLIWEMEGSENNREQLLNVAERAQHLLRVARRYITPGSARESLSATPEVKLVENRYKEKATADGLQSVIESDTTKRGVVSE